MDACVAASLSAPQCALTAAGSSLSSSTASRALVQCSAFRGTPLRTPSLAASRRRVSPVEQRQAIRNGLFDFLTAFTGPKVSDEQREALKEDLLAAIEPLERGLAASEDDQQAVEELAAQLEAVNPTKQPLRSPLINGKWKLLYTTSDTILARNRPFFLRPSGPIFQAIDAETLQARNLETWPFFNQVQATLTPTSASAVDVKFDVFKILSLIPIKAPDSARGSLEITYLDDDLRISRGNKGNLFVLAMEDASYRIPLAEEESEEEEE
ncbi:hypothetical protein CLOM_g16513 [Closterium sp. NIES-68]|nr:hypothetical protein CLOM_g16513 [Closterium sp. NIES-68]GJP70879.1 hypothetical protein CLOP_g1771 [Closterium sp. NIES-67]